MKRREAIAAMGALALCGQLPVTKAPITQVGELRRFGCLSDFEIRNFISGSRWFCHYSGALGTKLNDLQASRFSPQAQFCDPTRFE
jgi:hypothetical protein